MFGPRYIYCEHTLVPGVVARIAELGLGVELLFETTEDLWPTVRWENLLDLTDVISDAGIEASVHGPFHGLNLGSRDAHIRKYSLDVLCAGLEAARAFRSSHMVFHTGYLPQYPPIARARWLDSFCEELDPLLARAAELEVRLALENTYEPDPTLFEEIFDRFQTPALGMCLDVGHAACFGRVDPVLWSQRFAERICHLHVSDNDGHDDLHLGLGAGIVNFRAVLEPLARFGSPAGVTLEVPADSAAASRDAWDQLVKTMSGNDHT
jgi:sugar phosphate isomerase/epimerase